MSTLFDPTANRSRQVAPRLISAIILVVALAIVWGVACGIGVQIIGSLFGNRRSVYENVSLLRDGTPIIVSQESNGGRTTYRTLDGKPLELTNPREYLYVRYLRIPNKPKAIVDSNLGWSSRIVVESDYANPTTFWFAIRSAELHGKVYWQGINYFTKVTVGFLSKRGLQNVVPQEQDCFEVEGNKFCTTINGLNSVEDYLYYNEYADPSNVPPNWVVFQLDSDRIWRIDVRKKELELFREVPGILALSMIYEPQQIGMQRAAKEGTDQETESQSIHLKYRLAMRFAERIEVWSPGSDTTAIYPLPEELRERELMAMSLGDEKLLLDAHMGHWQQGYEQSLYWLEKDQGVTRIEKAQLIGYRPPSPRSQAWQTVPVVPIPAAWGFVEFVISPLSKLNNYQAPTYAAALTAGWSGCWPAFATLLAISAVLAWVAYRRQQQLFGSNAKLWALFVFLAGVPGWIAWRMMHPKPPLETCPQCGTIVPRDRSTCAKCAEPFPEPELTGIEVFA